MAGGAQRPNCRHVTVTVRSRGSRGVHLSIHPCPLQRQFRLELYVIFSNSHASLLISCELSGRAAKYNAVGLREPEGCMRKTAGAHHGLLEPARRHAEERVIVVAASKRSCF